MCAFEMECFKRTVTLGSVFEIVRVYDSGNMPTT